MEIELACGSCSGVVAFASRRRRSGGRLVGTCRSCSSVYSLAGGQVSPLDIVPLVGPSSLRRMTSWRSAGDG